MNARPRVKLTYDDFLLFPDDGKRHELIDGEHYVTPSPNTEASGSVGRARILLVAMARAHPIGRVSSRRSTSSSPTSTSSNRTCCTCRTSGQPRCSRRHVKRRAGTRDRDRVARHAKRDETIKRRLYERSGVAEYLSSTPTSIVFWWTGPAETLRRCDPALRGSR